MKKNPLVRIPINDGMTRYRLTYESNPCQPQDVSGRVEQMSMLQSLVDQPQLTYCGPVPFDSMKVFHNGSSWVVELEAVETRA